jgi:hypothetical protein
MHCSIWLNNNSGLAKYTSHHNAMAGHPVPATDCCSKPVASKKQNHSSPRKPCSHPRKRTAHGNISRTELPQTHNSLATTVEVPPPSPQTEPPRSQRYSQRVSNQTTKNHNSISTSPLPLPQTTAITRLSDPAPTYEPTTLALPRPNSKARTADTNYPPR